MYTGKKVVLDPATAVNWATLFPKDLEFGEQAASGPSRSQWWVVSAAALVLGSCICFWVHGRVQTTGTGGHVRGGPR